jgi:hypothetical protein
MLHIPYLWYVNLRNYTLSIPWMYAKHICTQEGTCAKHLGK